MNPDGCLIRFMKEKQIRISEYALLLLVAGTEEEAAEAYDIAAIKFRGLNAVTNFDMSRYDVKAILESNTLPIGGGAAKRLKEAQALESSRKREEMIALGSSTFQYGTSSSSRLHAYPLMQHHQFEQPQPLLTLQNHDMSSHFSHQDPLHQGYIQTQLQLHQQSGVSSYLQNNPQFYGGYLQNHPALLQGMMNMGSSSSSSVLENNNNNNSNVGGFAAGSGFGMASNPSSGNAVGAAEELGLVKVDYDMPAGGYGGWSAAAAESMQTSNGGVFTMWNE